MGKLVQKIPLDSETLSLCECTDGFWLWDETREINLSMRAKTPTAAFVEALHYYQRRLKDVESAYGSLKASVDTFVATHCEHSDHEEN